MSHKKCQHCRARLKRGVDHVLVGLCSSCGLLPSLRFCRCGEPITKRSKALCESCRADAWMERYSPPTEADYIEAYGPMGFTFACTQTVEHSLVLRRHGQWMMTESQMLAGMKIMPY